MLIIRTAMRSALFASVGVLLAQQGIWVDSPAFWIVMVAIVAAGLLGYAEGRGDV